MKIAIIGGTGVYSSRVFREKEKLRASTPYGNSNEIFRGSYRGIDVFFMPRHGREHEIPPHRVNYRANILALEEQGVERIIALNSVGAIDQELSPGSLIVPHDLIDFTTRASTFYNDKVVHVDMTEPYCPELRNALIQAVMKVKGRVFDRAVYAATEGPRFETPAEIQMLARLGADVVGMTGMPEAALARELEVCYSAICTSGNLAAGIKGERLTAKEVVEVVKESEKDMQKVIQEALRLVPRVRGCPCGSALEEAEI